MWRLKSWFFDLRFRIWYRDGSEKNHISFRHKKCNSQVVQLGDFRGFGPEFQCFQCHALVPAKDIDFRILSAEEVKRIKRQRVQMEKMEPQLYFRQAIIPHVVA